MQIENFRRIIPGADFLNEKTDWSQKLFLFYWMLKPLYFTDSGALQIADLVFLMVFGVYLMIRRGKVTLNPDHSYLLAFIACTAVINVSYYVFDLPHPDFLMATAYYVYNFMVVLMMDDFMHNRRFLRAFMQVNFFNFMVQLAVFVLKKGRYFYKDFRYMGTFNDPNQMAFSMFSTFILIFILFHYLQDQDGSHSRIFLLSALALAMFFVFQATSTGMLMGFASMLGMIALMMLINDKSPFYRFLQMMAIAVLALIVLVYLLEGPSKTSASLKEDSFIAYRLFEKFQKIDQGGLNAIINERGLDKIWRYPECLIYGSGEGAFMYRFPYSKFEIHSTLPAILFYYGMIPAFFLGTWLYRRLRHLNRYLLPVYLALLIESFTLAHQRQPALWIILLFAGLRFDQADKPKELGLRRSLK